MRGFHLRVGGTAVCDVLLIEEPQRFDWNLINLAGKARNPGSGRQLIEAAHAIFRRQEFDENGLRETISLRQVYLELGIPPALEFDSSGST